jgi:hypothetical protein
MSNVLPPFLEEAQLGRGCSPMSEGAIQEYTMAVMLETAGDNPVPLEELRQQNIFVIEVILKRIEVMNLPISFTPEGLIAAYALTENVVGRAIALLIDCLTKWEGQTVTASMLADLYPFGFYSEETFSKYVNDYLKNPDLRSKIKWAEIY